MTTTTNFICNKQKQASTVTRNTYQLYTHTDTRTKTRCRKGKWGHATQQNHKTHAFQASEAFQDDEETVMLTCGELRMETET